MISIMGAPACASSASRHGARCDVSALSVVSLTIATTTENTGLPWSCSTVATLLHLQQGIALPGHIAHNFAGYIHQQHRNQQRNNLNELVHTATLLHHALRHAHSQQH